MDICTTEVKFPVLEENTVKKRHDANTKQRAGWNNLTVAITPCDGSSNSTTWCCGDKNTDCCAENSSVKKYTIAEVFGDPIPTSTSSQSSAASSQTSATSQPTGSQSSAASPASTTTASSGNSGLSTGATAGIGVGVALGAIALIALAVMLYRRSQTKKRAQAAAPPYAAHEQYKPSEIYRYEAEAKQPAAQLASTETAIHGTFTLVKVTRNGC